MSDAVPKLGGSATTGLEASFPIEFFIVDQVPVSSAASAHSRDRWKESVASSARMAVEQGCWLSDQPLSITIFYFPDGRMRGDIDNIVKHILDALKGTIYLDDGQIERVVVQKFELGRPTPFENPTETLASALGFEPPVLYIRIDDDSSK
jgi:crossover junction endodeoxyribonuclease RusA